MLLRNEPRRSGALLIPFALMLLALAYGYLMASGGDWAPRHEQRPPAPAADPLVRLGGLYYRVGSLESLFDDSGWPVLAWRRLPDAGGGLGYRDRPVLFRFALHNKAPFKVERVILVDAPSMDRIRPLSRGEDGEIRHMRWMGDTLPASVRYLNIPAWAWPVTLAPGERRTFFFEVGNSGPVLFPLQVRDAAGLIHETTPMLVWKSALYGLLALVLMGNLSLLLWFRSPVVAWLNVFMVAAVHVQLTVDGFGGWLVWQDLPRINELLAVTPSLALVGFLQFTRFFLGVGGWKRGVLHGLSAAALLVLLTTPLGPGLPGQGALLWLAGVSTLFSLWLGLRRFRRDVYARYYLVGLASLLVGLAMISLRTVGWLPVNGFTSSGFYLGLCGVSVVLTLGLLRHLAQERRGREQARLEALEQQRLKSRVEVEYDRLLKTHQVTRKPNRGMLEHELRGLVREKLPHALCVLRLSHYSRIEGLLGYQWVESALREVLAELERFLEERLGDAIVRVQGHCLSTIDTAHHAVILRRGPDGPLQSPARLWADFQEGVQLTGRAEPMTLDWNPALGVALFPEHGEVPWDLIGCASFAALEERQALSFYEPQVAERQEQLHLLMLDLDRALGNGDIRLVYQPKVRLADRRVIGCEALIRWRHPEFGWVSPGLWIPFAEQTGEVIKVTLWVIRKVCEDLPALVARYGVDLRVAVNTSGRDLEDDRFPDQVAAIVEAGGISPDRLVLEVTETAVAADPRHAHAILHRLAGMGFRLSLDDFGTGQSSLGALASFDLHELKLDQSFVQDITRDPNRQRIFRTALEMGRSLGLEVVVEGIDTEEAAEWIAGFTEFEGLYGQGYLLGRPDGL